MAATSFDAAVAELALVATAVLAVGLAGLSVYLVPRAISWAKGAI